MPWVGPHTDFPRTESVLRGSEDDTALEEGEKEKEFSNYVHIESFCGAYWRKSVVMKQCWWQMRRVAMDGRHTFYRWGGIFSVG